MSKATHPATARLIDGAIEISVDRGRWASLTPEQRTRVHNAAKSAVDVTFDWRAAAAGAEPPACDVQGQIVKALATGRITSAQMRAFVQSSDIEGLRAYLRRT